MSMCPVSGLSGYTERPEESTMQPPFQQSAASAHIDDMMRVAQAYRLASVHRPRHGSAVARGMHSVRGAFAQRSRVRKPQHA
jgi:hypothetical protein